MRPARALVADLEARLRPLELELSEAWWEANTNSSPEADERRTRAEVAHRELLADPELFAEVRAARDAAGRPTHCSRASSTCCTTRSCRTR